jgi:hypothetical protein
MKKVMASTAEQIQSIRYGVFLFQVFWAKPYLAIQPVQPVCCKLVKGMLTSDPNHPNRFCSGWPGVRVDFKALGDISVSSKPFFTV